MEAPKAVQADSHSHRRRDVNDDDDEEEEAELSGHEVGHPLRTHGHGHSHSHNSSASNSSSVYSSAESSSDLAPRMQAEFNNLSAVLAETNENLLSFEFMLKQYRQLAKIRPIVEAEAVNNSSSKRVEDQDKDGMSQSQVEMTNKLEGLLSELSQAVSKVGSFKYQEAGISPQQRQEAQEDLSNEVERLKKELRLSEGREVEMRQKCSALEQECQGKARMCEQLTESVHRARAALQEERQRSERLDEKLEKEQRAARKVGQDITKYVGQMRAMEEEVALLRKRGDNKKAAAAAPVVVDMRGDTLTATIVEEERTESGLERHVQATSSVVRKLEDERARNRELLTRLARYESQEVEYERQLAELKEGLVKLQKELEDKCQLMSVPMMPALEAAAAATKGDAEARLEAAAKELQRRLAGSEEELKTLKGKSKKLLRQYQGKKVQLEEERRKVLLARECLSDVMVGCAASERNYCAILCHLGSELEVSARLLAAYLGVELAQRQPVQMSGRPMAEWFSDVHSLSSWLQGQLVAFGKRVWTGREAPPTEILSPPSIPNEEKHNPDDDEGHRRSQPAREAIRSQEFLRQERRQTFEKIKDSLA